MTINEAIEQANQMLRGLRVPAMEVISIVKVLHGDRKFGLARKILDRCAEDPDVRRNAALRKRIAQKRALSTYKDPDLATDLKLDLALAILRETDDLDTTTDQETLGLTGAIYKRLWEATGQDRHLETSAAY